MAWIALGGKTRRFKNTETGEEISRRQYEKLRGINFEAKAKQNRLANLEEALARPARGRTKAVTKKERELRVQSEQARVEQKRLTAIERKARSLSNKKKTKKIRPQLLQAGHFAERVPFHNYEQYETLQADAKRIRAADGKHLVPGYAIGVVGYDERTGQELGAMLTHLMSPTIKLSEDELDEMTTDFIAEHTYFIFSYWFMHLRFNQKFAQQKLAKKRAAKLKSVGITK